MRGRKPKPTHLKVLHGTFRKDRAAKHEPQPSGTAVCPSWLDSTAKAEWRRLAPELIRLGLLTSVDRDAFAAYCQCVTKWRQAQSDIETNGLILTTPKGFRQKNPAVTICFEALSQMRAYSSLFGLSPSDRSKLSVAPKGDHEEENDFA